MRRGRTRRAKVTLRRPAITKFDALEHLEMRLSVALFAERVFGLELDPRQRELLGAAGRRVLLNCARQWGKSTMTAVKAIHRALYEPGSLTLVITPSGRQSGEFLWKIRSLCRIAAEEVTGDGENRMSVMFENGSRVVGLPANERTTRGFSDPGLIVVDEAARLDDDLYFALLPTLARGCGDLWLLSTPNGKTGFFWKAWSEEEGWFKMKVTAEECPRTSKEILAEQRKIFSEDLYRQEYLCEFVDNDDAMFKMEQVMSLFVDYSKDLRL